MDNIHQLPYDVAEIVFNNPASEPKSYQLCCETEAGTAIAPVDLFEIFLTILTEGIFIKNKSITAETLKQFDERTINALQPWLHSLGYDVNVEAVTRQETEKYEKYYCKVILKADPSWAMYFELHAHEMTKDYHFIFGGNSPFIKNEKCTLNNLFAIFTINDMVYKISFSCI